MLGNPDRRDCTASAQEDIAVKHRQVSTVVGGAIWVSIEGHEGGLEESTTFNNVGSGQDEVNLMGTALVGGTSRSMLVVEAVYHGCLLEKVGKTLGTGDDDERHVGSKALFHICGKITEGLLAGLWVMHSREAEVAVLLHVGCRVAMAS